MSQVELEEQKSGRLDTDTNVLRDGTLPAAGSRSVERVATENVLISQPVHILKENNFTE